MAKGRGRFFVRKVFLPIQQLISKACCCSARSAASRGNGQATNQGLDSGDRVFPGAGKTLIARASYYQREMSSRWAGLQCTSMAASSLALSVVVPPKDWRMNLMDKLLVEGDTFHCSQLKRLGRTMAFGNNLRVGWDELERESTITVAGRSVMLQKESNYYGIVEPPSCVNLDEFGALTLVNALDIATRSSTGAILTVGDYSTGVMRVQGVDGGDEYMVFDSHSRNSQGYNKLLGGGTAILLTFHGLNQLHKYIQDLYKPQDEFNIVSFSASVTDVEVDVNSQEDAHPDTLSGDADMPATVTVVAESEGCSESALCVTLAHLAKVAATINVALNTSMEGDKDGISFIGYSPIELDY